MTATAVEVTVNSTELNTFVKKRFMNSISVEPKEGESGIMRSYVVTASGAR